MSQNYEGPAVVLVDGAEYSVHARLHANAERVGSQSFGGSQSLKGNEYWGGTIEGLNEGVAWAIDETGGAQLRAEDERKGQFSIQGGHLGGGPLTIKGSGLAPFGD
jgi:hypothetical protein